MRAEDIWAKSIVGNRKRGESLSEHTQRVLSTFDQWRNRLPFLSDICKSPRFWNRAGLSLLLHDVGKCAPGFQTMVKENIPFRHRHEVLSTALVPLLVDPDTDDFSWVAAGVLAHHKDFVWISQSYPSPDPLLDFEDGLNQLLPEIENGFLENAYEYYQRFLEPQIRNRFEAPSLGRIWPSPAAAIRSVRRSIDAYAGLVRELHALPSNDPKNLEAVFLRGIVNLCDHAGSAHVRLHDRPFPSVECLYGRFKFNTERLFFHQSRVAQVPGNAVLTAPTGSGKTEAALIWVAAQDEFDRTPAFYVLPYQASLNAMRKRLGRLFDQERQVTLQHSYAVGSLYRLQLEKGYNRTEAELAAKRERNLARLHTSTVRLLTPYQLLKAPFQLPGHESVGTDMAGARFILDEIHAYEPYRLGMMLALFRYLANRLRARFLFMSATMPKILRHRIRESIGEMSEVRADVTTVELFQRHRLHLFPDDLVSQYVIQSVSRDHSEGRAVLIVATTVRRAQELQQELSTIADPMVLHAKFCGRDRAQKEMQIGKFVGRDLDASQRAPCVVIATQVVEVSLDLDFDVLYSDPAPLEALIQRFGRVNRGMRYPDLPVHVSVVIPEGCPVYSRPMIESTLSALSEMQSQVLHDDLLQLALDRVYGRAVGDQWRADLGKGMMGFERDVLASWRAFGSNPQIRELFDRMFDGQEVLPAALAGEYSKLVQDQPFEAHSLMVPVSMAQRQMLWRNNLLTEREYAGHPVSVANVPYDSDRGLQLHPRSLESE